MPHPRLNVNQGACSFNERRVPQLSGHRGGGVERSGGDVKANEDGADSVPVERKLRAAWLSGDAYDRESHVRDR